MVELLVVIAILAILAALIFTSARRAIAAAHSSTCLNNLKQMASLATSEASIRGYYPPSLSQSDGSSGVTNNGDHFYSLITTETFASCPAAKFTGTNPRNGRIITAYGANPTVMPYYKIRGDGTTTNPLIRPSQIARPSEVFLFTDGAQFNNANPRALAFSARWWGRQVGEEKNAEQPLTTAECPERGFWDDLPIIPFRHAGKANIVFVDGHAESIREVGDLKQRNLYWNY